MLMHALLFGLGAFYLAQLARAVPIVARAAQRGQRPWSCDTCIAFWMSAVVATPMVLLDGPSLGTAPWVTLAAAGFALVLLGQHRRGCPPASPPPFPPPDLTAEVELIEESTDGR